MYRKWFWIMVTASFLTLLSAAPVIIEQMAQQPGQALTHQELKMYISFWIIMLVAVPIVVTYLTHNREEYK